MFVNVAALNDAKPVASVVTLTLPMNVFLLTGRAARRGAEQLDAVSRSQAGDQACR